MSCSVASQDKSLIVSLHDFHAGSLTKISGQISWLDKLGVNQTTVLAVPDYHVRGVLRSESEEAEFLRKLAYSGHEVALHGYYHLRIHREIRGFLKPKHFFITKLYTANEAEFYDLTRLEANLMLKRGRQVLEDCGIVPQGFVAPGWLIPRDVLEVVWESGFLWSCLAGEVLNRFGFTQKCRTFCWSTRSAWRVPVSLVWNHLLLLVKSSSLVARISLHPDDLEYYSVRRQIRKIITFFIENDFCPVSYVNYLSKKCSSLARTSDS